VRLRLRPLEARESFFCLWLCFVCEFQTVASAVTAALWTARSDLACALLEYKKARQFAVVLLPCALSFLVRGF
jgi:hypothetical protein